MTNFSVETRVKVLLKPLETKKKQKKICKSHQSVFEKRAQLKTKRKNNLIEKRTKG